jgi:hypothetical protein
METSTMKLSPLVTLVAALVCAASPAAAQFTSAVVPPQAKQRVDTTVARADSMRKQQEKLAQRMKDMNAWVDSAAVALAAQPNAQAADTSAAARSAAGASRTGEQVTATATGEVAVGRDGATKFKNGAPAPATATELPLLLVLGIGATLAGVALRRR